MYTGNNRSVKRVYDRTRRAAYTKLKTLYPELTSEDKYYRFIRLYKGIYQGFSASSEGMFTGRRFSIGQGYEDYDFKTINVAKMVCERQVKLSFSENTHIVIDNGKKDKDQKLNEWFEKRFKEIDLLGDLINYGERSFYAMGGLAVYPEIIDGGFEYTFVDSDLYIPLSWRKGTITEEVTAEVLKIKQIYYLLVGEYTLEEFGSKVTYRLFRGDKQGTSFSKEIKDIGKVLKGQALEIEYKDKINKTYVVYEGNAKSNNKDYDTPLGISIFGNSIDTIQGIAQATDVFFTEFKNGRKRIVVPTELLKERLDPKTSKPIRYFDASDDVYQAFNSAKVEADIKEMTTELRVTDILAAIQGLLNILAVEVGESAGTFTFDSTTGAITATEVVSKNSDTFKTKKLHEKKWASFITNMIKQTIRLCEALPGELDDPMPTVNKEDFKIIIEFDDSIITDDKANRNESRVEVSQGLKAKKTYLIKDRNMTEEDANTELALIKAEEDAEFDSLDPNDSAINDKSTFEQCVLQKMSEGNTESEAQQMCGKQKKQQE